MRSMLMLLMLLALATPAFASDGVLEVNQTCAVQTGCFAGDSAGFPVTITAPGTSYVLTSRLLVPNGNTDAIVVNTSSVSIDLGGFEIAGPVSCLGVPLVCSLASGTGSGVNGVVSSNRGISVKNGSITGMGFNGVQLGSGAEVSNLRVRWNRFDGISIIDGSIGSIISGNSAYGNGNIGISAEGGATLVGNTANGNGSSGLRIASGGTISGNTADDNGSDGIFSGGRSTISGNSARNNGGTGITASSGSTIIGNTTSQNGITTNNTFAFGIDCGPGCLVSGNTVRGNRAWGLRLDSLDSGYSDNVVTANTIGTMLGAIADNNRGGNYCAGPGTLSASCP